MHKSLIADIRSYLTQYKRQTLNIFSIIHRYLTIKKASPAQRKKIQPWTYIFAGKAAPGMPSPFVREGHTTDLDAGYYIAKLVIRLIVNVGKVVVRFRLSVTWRY